MKVFTALVMERKSSCVRQDIIVRKVLKVKEILSFVQKVTSAMKELLNQSNLITHACLVFIVHSAPKEGLKKEEFLMKSILVKLMPKTF